MARSTIWPQPQADGDLVAPWSFPFSGSGHLNLEEADGWITTDGTDTTPHSAQISHGITTTGDWQVAFLGDVANTAGVDVLLVNASLNGYFFRFGTNLLVQVVTDGAPGTTIATAARVTGSHVPAFVECTYTAATDTFEIFEDGVSRGSGTNNTYEATSKTLCIALAAQTGGVRTRCRDLYVQDFVQVLGRPPRPALPPLAARRHRPNLIRSR